MGWKCEKDAETEVLLVHHEAGVHLEATREHETWQINVVEQCGTVTLEKAEIDTKNKAHLFEVLDEYAEIYPKQYSKHDRCDNCNSGVTYEGDFLGKAAFWSLLGGNQFEKGDLDERIIAFTCTNCTQKVLELVEGMTPIDYENEYLDNRHLRNHDFCSKCDDKEENFKGAFTWTYGESGHHEEYILCTECYQELESGLFSINEDFPEGVFVSQ